MLFQTYTRNDTTKDVQLSSIAHCCVYVRGEEQHIQKSLPKHGASFEPRDDSKTTNHNEHLLLYQYESETFHQPISSRTIKKHLPVPIEQRYTE